MFNRFFFFVSSLLCCSVSAALQAQTLYSEDFTDGVADGWDQVDLNDPSFGPGTFDASSGAFVLAVTGEMPAGFAGSHGTLATWEPTEAEPLADGYFQGTVRANTHGSTVSLLSRADPAAGTDYGFFASTLHGTFGIEVFDASKLEPQIVLGLMDPQQFPFSAGEDWIIQGGTVGDQITMKVWRPGELEPAEPQLSFTDTTFEQGALCLITYADIGLMTEPVSFSGTFDDLSFNAVPEPSTAIPCLCAFLALIAQRRKKSHLSLQEFAPCGERFAI